MASEPESEMDESVHEASAPDREAATAELSAEALATFRDEQRRRGVVYLARVPPFMKPAKIKHIMERVGPVDRVYLVPEGTLVDIRWPGLACLVRRK